MQSTYTYLMLPIAFFIAGLLPILLWNRRAKVNFNMYLLGWLSWFCSVSVKIFGTSHDLGHKKINRNFQ
ncbi:hypothetical protein C4E24_04745 [ANME-1 cluster archaeon AG-394-G21]|nr:hypothetical protein [ANME-1 cluster archaeon AG-394-G21]